MSNTATTPWSGIAALIAAIVCAAMARIPPDAAALARKATGGGGAVAAELAGQLFDLAANVEKLLQLGSAFPLLAGW